MNADPAPPPIAPTAPGRDTHRHITPAGQSRRAWIVLLLTIILGVALDLASKHLAFAHIADNPVQLDRHEVLEVIRTDPHLLLDLLPMHRPVTVIPGVLDFQLVLNSGAVFGAGQGRRWFFIGFTTAALLFAAALFAFWTDRRDHLSHIAIGLIVGGGIGNLYDRIVYACVRDFIHPLPGHRLPFGLKWPSGDPHIWPYVSNVADAFLLIGIIMLMFRLWKHDAPPSAPKPETERSNT